MPWTSNLSTYALISLAELNSALNHPAQTGDSRPQDDRKEAIINGASLALEHWLDRYLVTRGSLTEYHSPHARDNEIYLGEWPITSVTTVHEDPSWASKALADRYPASTLLAVDTDYQVLKPTREPAPVGRLLRLNGSWPTGRRVTKVVYASGYANTAAVPKPIKDFCIELCALMWRDRDRAEYGIASRTDATGAVVRTVPSMITETLKSKMRAAGYRPRAEFAFAETWERDA